MKKGLLLVGGGGHCRSVIDVIETNGVFAIQGIVQPDGDGGNAVLGYPVLGNDADLPGLLSNAPYALVTVGQIKTPSLRRRLFESLRSMKAICPVIVSPKAYVSRHAELGDGSVVMHGAIINAGVRVGVNSIVNTLALLEHDVQVGDHCHVSTGARVNGGVRIGDGCFIGSGAILKQGVTIGAGSIIGAGCTVFRDVPENTLIKVL